MTFEEPPKEIWLQYHGDAEPENTPVSADGISWCWEPVFTQDIKYVREDAVPSPKFIILMCKNGREDGKPLGYGQGDEPFPDQLLARIHAKGFATREEAEQALEDTLEQNKKNYFAIVPLS